MTETVTRTIEIETEADPEPADVEYHWRRYHELCMTDGYDRQPLLPHLEPTS